MFDPQDEHNEIICQSHKIQRRLTSRNRAKSSMPRLVFIIGPMASGKSTIAAQFVRNHTKGKAFIFEFAKVPKEHYASIAHLECILKHEEVQLRKDYDIIITLDPENVTSDEVNWMLQQIDLYVGTVHTSCICILNPWNWTDTRKSHRFDPEQLSLTQFNWDVYQRFTNSQKVLDQLPNMFSVRS